MPTRKQKRRRKKDRRHEYEYVYVDEEGQEVEVDEPDEPAPATAATKSSKAPAKAKTKPTGRALREPPEPSWSRAARRALPWQIGIFVLVVFLLRSGPLASRVLIGVLYALLFIPMMYMTDRLMRNRWLKQQAALPQKDKRAKRP
jgi:Flp pilus assembly protein TadB